MQKVDPPKLGFPLLYSLQHWASLDLFDTGLTDPSSYPREFIVSSQIDNTQTN
jgi:hypothetical protein